MADPNANVSNDELRQLLLQDLLAKKPVNKAAFDLLNLRNQQGDPQAKQYMGEFSTQAAQGGTGFELNQGATIPAGLLGGDTSDWPSANQRMMAQMQGSQLRSMGNTGAADTTVHPQPTLPGGGMPTGIPPDIAMGHRGAADGSDLSVYAPAGPASMDNVPFVGGEPWMSDVPNMGNIVLQNNPLAGDQAGPANQYMMLDLYAKQQDLPGWWAQQNQQLYSSLPALYALNHPDSSALSPVQMAGMASELGPGGFLGTPGQYLDVGSEWDKLFTNPRVATGAGGNEDIATMAPADQVAAVTSAMRALSPFMAGQTADYLTQNIQQASLEWSEQTQTGQTTLDFLTWLEVEKQADQWV